MDYKQQSWLTLVLFRDIQFTIEDNLKSNMPVSIKLDSFETWLDRSFAQDYLILCGKINVTLYFNNYTDTDMIPYLNEAIKEVEKLGVKVTQKQPELMDTVEEEEYKKRYYFSQVLEVNCNSKISLDKVLKANILENPVYSNLSFKEE